MDELAGEWLQKGQGIAGYSSGWMDRGNELEPEARAAYEFQTNNTVTEVGFVFRDVLRRVGGSPDGMIEKDGGLEIKCPKLGNHVRNLRTKTMPRTYIPQVQGNMWLTDRKWWDFMSYYPGLPSMIKRIERDNAYISLLEKAMTKFLADYSDVKLQLEDYRK